MSKMKATNFVLADYLNRIGFKGDIDISLPTLFGLMKRQLKSVAFENTTVQKKQTPSLIPNDIVEKIVKNKRGGYCYEVNGLFAIALNHIGFEWYFAAARPMTYTERRPKTHMVIIVNLLGEKWLCDTGFGGYGLREPIRLSSYSEVTQDSDKFKIEFDESTNEYIVSSLVANNWQKLYGFADSEQEFIEFSLANYFNATHPDTIFTQKKIAMLQSENGRKILIDNELKLIENGNLTKLDVRYEDALKEHFGLSF